MLRIGSVPYANARPLLEGLGTDVNVLLRMAPPARLSEQLRRGDVDVALIPSVEYLRQGGLVLVPTGAITSRGPVASVGLFCRRPLRAGGRVLLDASSRTSAALVRILLEGPLGAPGCTFDEVPPDVDPGSVDADATMLIGDPALTLDRAGLDEIDLGEAWTEWTGLPFVWAVWAARDAAVAAEAEPLLAAARRRGGENLSSIVWREAGRLGVDESVMGRYLTRHIRFDLGDDERAGLERFARECETAGLIVDIRSA